MTSAMGHTEFSGGTDGPKDLEPEILHFSLERIRKTRRASGVRNENSAARPDVWQEPRFARFGRDARVGFPFQEFGSGSRLAGRS
jgi:hypothetical protein